MKKLKISKGSFYIGLFLSLLFVASTGNPFIQFAGISLVSSTIILSCRGVVRIETKTLFYLAMIVLAFFQVLLFWKDSYSLNYIINSLIASGLWGLMLMASLSVSTILKKIPIHTVDKGLKIFFKVNIILMMFQYVMIAIEKNAIIPYTVSMGAGDFIKGIFTNSSVSCIVFSFYTIYFYFKRNRKYTFLSVIFMIASTFMSGIVIFLGVVLFMVFWYFSLKSKLKILFGVAIGIYIFSLISPQNVDYVIENLTVRLFSETDQARKIVSLKQTKDYVTSGITEAIVGAGGGKFSSRTAFLTSGDYVAWFPQEYKFSSDEFKNNHFSLWNSELLKLPYKDGTANQPFSFYNKIFGEYGLLGFVLFLVLYLGKWIKNYNNLTYGKHILFLMMAYFILDYWFEYFTVIIFCELFINLDLKEHFENEKSKDTMACDR